MEWHNSKQRMEVALHYIGQLLEFCDLNGYGQNSHTVKEAREYWLKTIQEIQK